LARPLPELRRERLSAKDESPGPIRVERSELFRFLGGAGRMMKLYLRIKLRICPLLRAEAYFPKSGKFVDLGCGNGLFPAILKLGAPARDVLGIDLDARKLAEARKALAGVPGLDFREGDVVSFAYPPADVFSLIDVLYLLPYEDQDAVLGKCRAALKPGGTLLVKEMDTRPRWKYIWNAIQETVAVKLVGFTLGGRFYFRGRAETIGRLRDLGFDVAFVRLDRGYWYPHVLYLARRK
jgi:SAM-dependent methyltransferase